MSWKLWIPAVKGNPRSWHPLFVASCSCCVPSHSNIHFRGLVQAIPFTDFPQYSVMWWSWFGQVRRAKLVYLFSVLLWWAETGHGRSILHHTAIRALFFQGAGKPLSTHHCRHPHFLNRGIVTLYSVSLPLYCLRNTLNLATCYWNSFLVSGADGVFAWFSCPFGNLTQFLSEGRDVQLSSSYHLFQKSLCHVFIPFPCKTWTELGSPCLLL